VDEEMPPVTLKLTKSKKGVLIIFPNPHSGVAHTYITSVKYLSSLLQGGLRRDMLGCNYLGDAPYEQFLQKTDGKVYAKKVEGNPLGYSAGKERESLTQQIKDDDW
jgi:hypothetical protein